MASARKMTPAQQVAKSTQEILQVAIEVLYNGTIDDTVEGLGPHVTLERKLNISKHVSKQLVQSLEFLGYLEWTGLRGMGAFYYVPRRLPRIPLTAVERLLKEFGAPPARHLQIA